MKSLLEPENLERMKRMQEGTATMQDYLGILNLNGGGNNNINNLNVNNNNWANNNNLNNPFGMFGMPMGMGNPFMMNPMMMGMPNLYGQGFGNNNFNNNMNNLNNNMMNTPEQLKEKYKEQIKSIKDMGFDNEDNILNALTKTNGNINAAIERLISGQK